MRNQTQIPRDYLYNYGSKTFNIFLDGNRLVATKPDGTLLETVTVDSEDVAWAFDRLKNKYILDYDNQVSK